jgi:hypothetical protein
VAINYVRGNGNELSAVLLPLVTSLRAPLLEYGPTGLGHVDESMNDC